MCVSDRTTDWAHTEALDILCVSCFIWKSLVQLIQYMLVCVHVFLSLSLSLLMVLPTRGPSTSTSTLIEHCLLTLLCIMVIVMVLLLSFVLFWQLNCIESSIERHFWYGQFCAQLKVAFFLLSITSNSVCLHLCRHILVCQIILFIFSSPNKSSIFELL